MYSYEIRDAVWNKHFISEYVVENSTNTISGSRLDPRPHRDGTWYFHGLKDEWRRSSSQGVRVLISILLCKRMNYQK